MRNLSILLFFIFISVGFKIDQNQTTFGDNVKPNPAAQVQIESTTRGFLGPRMTTAQRDAIASPPIGLEIYNTTLGEKEIYDGLTWTGIGTGNAFFRVTQVAHGRPVGYPLTPVYLTGGVWTDAKADAQASLATHLIVQVIDVDTFVVAQAGRFKAPAHGLTIEEYYFVSELTAGVLTTTEPPVYSNPIVFVEDADIIHVLPYRAYGNTPTTTPNTVLTVFGRNGNVVAVSGDYTASQITNVPAGLVSATNMQAAIDELDSEKLAASATLNALNAYNTNGFLVQTSASNFAGRSLTAGSTKLTISDGDGVAGNPSIDVDPSQIDITTLLNYSANGAIDWTNATQNFLTTGTLTSGNITVGDISSAGIITSSGFVNGRDMTADGTKLDGIEALADVTDTANVDAAGAIMDGDFVANGLMTRLASGSYASRTITAGSTKVVVTNGNGVAGSPSIDVDPSQIDITGLLNFNANRYIDHSSVVIDTSTSDDGISGGGNLTASRTLTMDINSCPLEPTLQNGDEFIFWDLSASRLRKTRLQDIVAAVPASGEANTASNLGAGAQLFSTKVGVDLRFRSLTAGSAKVAVVQNANDVSVDVNEGSLDITNLGGFDPDNYVDHTTVNINTALGLSGGGNIASTRTIALDIPSLSAETVPANDDLLLIYDTSASTHRKMTKADFLTGIVSAPVDSVFGRIGVVTAQAGDYTASQVTNVPAGNVVATTVQAAITELDSDLTAGLATKQNTITGGATTITSSNLTASRALVSDGSGKVAVSAVTSTELGHVSGVTSAIQTQLNTKLQFPRFALTGGVTNVGANATMNMTTGNSAVDGGLRMAFNGEIYAISVQINNTRTTGTCTVQSTINGVAQNAAGQTTIIDGTNTQGNFQIIATPIPFNAGDVIGAQTVTVGFAPTGSDAGIILYTRDR